MGQEADVAKVSETDLADWLRGLANHADSFGRTIGASEASNLRRAAEELDRLRAENDDRKKEEARLNDRLDDAVAEIGQLRTALDDALNAFSAAGFRADLAAKNDESS
jgi:ABC-type transporter Mla subunit MlaD